MKKFTLEKDGFIGELYKGNRHKGKAVLYVGGASCTRKMTLKMGKFIADKGFTVLFLGYYLWEGLPRKMWDIPVDYAEKAAKWLVSHGYEVCMMGASTGAGYTLLSASLVPEIHGAVGISPFDHVFEGMEMFKKAPDRSVYKFHGKEYPCSRFDIVKNGWINALKENKKAGNNFKGFMRYGYETSRLVPDSRIKVENINGDILLTYSEYDIMWPADLAVPRMLNELKRSHFGHRVSVIKYKGKGHGLGVGSIGGKLLDTIAFAAMKNNFAQSEKAKKDIIKWLDKWCTRTVK